jgi:malate synthase
MMAYEKIGEISVANVLRDFISDEVLPGTDISAGQFWSGLAGLIDAFAPRIRDHLRFRDELQEKIDAYHRVTASRPFNPAE